MAALATCHRQAGDLDTAARLFTQLYEINERQSEGGAANQSGVMLARTLADIFQEAEKDRWVWCLCGCLSGCLGVSVRLCVCASVCLCLCQLASGSGGSYQSGC